MSKNNPTGVRLSQKLKVAIDNNPSGATQFINGLYDTVNTMFMLDAIKLDEGELQALKDHLQGVFIDDFAIQAIPQDIDETKCESLIAKLQNATFGQVWATLVKYNLVGQ